MTENRAEPNLSLRIVIILMCLILAVEAAFILFMSIAGRREHEVTGNLSKSLTGNIDDFARITRGAAPVLYGEVDIKRNTASAEWESAISKIEARYGEKLPENRVIFYGSSSIRKWKTLAEDMSELEVLNHGFGGSMTCDCLYYADRMVVAFRPEAIVFYAGTNDIGKGRTVDEAYRDTIDFFYYIHHKLPDTHIYYIEQTQQPDRAGKWPLMQELDEAVQEYIRTDDGVTYIATSDVLNNGDGSPRHELFVADGLHFNSSGYEEWTKIIQPVLYENLLKAETEEH